MELEIPSRISKKNLASRTCVQGLRAPSSGENARTPRIHKTEQNGCIAKGLADAIFRSCRRFRGLVGGPGWQYRSAMRRVLNWVISGGLRKSRWRESLM